MFLVDTDVISATAPNRRGGQDAVLDWLKRQGASVFLSVVTVAELTRGVEFLAGMGHSRKAAALAAWKDGIVEGFADRILPIDARVAERAGELLGAAEARGHDPGIPDACIAATADLGGLIVVTANARHFRALRVRFQPLGDPEAGRP